MVEELDSQRKLIEKETNEYIPIMMSLKGTNVRLGKFYKNSVKLIKGQEFRFSSQKELVKIN